MKSCQGSWGWGRFIEESRLSLVLKKLFLEEVRTSQLDQRVLPEHLGTKQVIWLDAGREEQESTGQIMKELVCHVEESRVLIVILSVKNFEQIVCVLEEPVKYRSDKQHLSKLPSPHHPMENKRPLIMWYLPQIFSVLIQSAGRDSPDPSPAFPLKSLLPDLCSSRGKEQHWGNSPDESTWGLFPVAETILNVYHITSSWAHGKTTCPRLPCS